MRFKLKILWFLLGFRLFGYRRADRATLERVQQRRLRRLFLRLRGAPFYRELIDAGAPLSDFPVINKAVFMENFDRINTRGIRREQAFQVALDAEKSRDFTQTIAGVTVGLSTGTSGNKGIFLADETERARWTAAVLDRVIGLSEKKRRVAFFLRANSKLYESVRSRLLEFHFFDILKPHAENMEALRRCRADILVAQPSVLRDIARSAEADPRGIALKKVISVAEVLDPLDARFFEQVFGVRTDQVYQCTEGFLAHTCAAGTLHFNEDFLIIEKKYLDAAQTRFHPVITDLYRRTQPVIRYLLDDIILEGGPCACGSHFSSIRAIEGRADDTIVLENAGGVQVSVYPDFIRRALVSASDAISFYTVTQTGARRLVCYIEGRAGADLDSLRKAVTHELQTLLSGLGVPDADIQFSDTYTHQQGSKLRRIRHEYHP